MTAPIPAVALSVHQPWAWAIVSGNKDIENRSARAVNKGAMRRGRIAIHASKGMTQDEYAAAAAFMASIGVACPPPASLVRGAIIGAVTVTAIVYEHDSPWFFGRAGLVLADASSCEPVSADGALGFFKWRPSIKGPEEARPWMLAYGGQRPDPKPSEHQLDLLRAEGEP